MELMEVLAKHLPDEGKYSVQIVPQEDFPAEQAACRGVFNFVHRPLTEKQVLFGVKGRDPETGKVYMQD